MQWCKINLTVLVFFCLLACRQPDIKMNTNTNVFAGHYDLSSPQVINVPPVLDEISGICFNNGNTNIMYAQQHDDGKVFKFKLGDDNITETKFAKDGEYEDIGICNNFLVMLRSDGTLFTFPLDETINAEAANVQEFKKLLPKGEYEGLYADSKTNQVYVLCKHCRKEASGTSGIYILSLDEEGVLKPVDVITVDVKRIAEDAGKKKLSFQPSAITKNEQTGEWYLLSSINKVLVLADKNFIVKDVFKLNTNIFNQPEGITFDSDNTMYIANEKGSRQTATVLKIAFKN